MALSHVDSTINIVIYVIIICIYNAIYVPSVLCLQCFDAVGWAAGRASGL